MGKSIKIRKDKKMGARVTYSRNNSWTTRSNKVRQVRTPGGRLVVQYVKKIAKRPGNGMRTSSRPLGGIKAYRPADMARSKKHTRTVSRAYGGVFGHDELRNRIIRTFLTEEVKNVKKTMALAAAGEKKKKNQRGGKGNRGTKARK